MRKLFGNVEMKICGRWRQSHSVLKTRVEDKRTKTYLPTEEQLPAV